MNRTDLVTFTSGFFRRCGTPAGQARREARELVREYLARVDPDGLVNLERLYRLMAAGGGAEPGDFVAVAVLLGFSPRTAAPQPVDGKAGREVPA